MDGLPWEQEMHEIVPSVENAGGASGGASSSTAPSRDDVALDIDELFEKAEQQRPQTETPARDGFLIISRVREQTRNVRPDEYTPHYVPIGPYHSSTLSQRRIDEKFKYLYMCLDAASKRTRKDKKVLLGELLQKMKDLQSDASRCYSDRFDGMGAENDFLQMLLLDGCYLLVCFADRLAPQQEDGLEQQQEDGLEQQQEDELEQQEDGLEQQQEDELEQQEDGLEQQQEDGLEQEEDGLEQQQEDGLEKQQTATTESASDVKVRETWYLLENQIPFFVVQKIYELVTGKSPSDVLAMFAKYVKKLLQDQLYISKTADEPPTSDQQDQLYISATADGPPTSDLQDQLYISATADEPPTSDLQDPSHLLHLVHTYFSLKENSPAAQAEGGASDSSGTGRFRRATEYCSYANVRFRPRKFDDGASRSILDVSLAGGALLVPLLRVDNDTWTILRNLMALEQHHAVSLKRRVTAYCLFMSQLACTEEDVALLVRRRVVQHFLGSDAEAAAGFADLCKGVVLDVDDLNSNYLKPVWHELEGRYRSRKHNHVAWFRQAHCRNLGYFAAFVAAVILFAMQVMQGICTVISCKK